VKGALEIDVYDAVKILGFIWAMSRSAVMPALLTKMSTPPKSAVTCATVLPAASKSETSH
jgi:hypothetical protein